MVPRICHYDLDDDLSTQEKRCPLVSPLPDFTDTTVLHLNHKHHFSLIKLADLPETPQDVLSEVDDSDLPDLKYIVNSHFTNQDANLTDFQSLTRVFLYTKDVEVETMIDYIISLYQNQ